MPQLSYFYGISIRMYFREHPPPHFHATYAEFEAQIRLDDGVIMEGSLPRRAARLVEEWRRLHHAELVDVWLASRAEGHFARIEPLP